MQLCMYVWMYVCMYVYMYVCMYVCRYIFYIFIEHAPLQGRNTTCFIILDVGDAVTSAISVFPLHLPLQFLGFLLYQSLT